MTAAKRLAATLGLLRPARSLRNTVRAWAHALRTPKPVPEDGLPLPPARLVLRVAGTPDRAWFLSAGRLAARSLREALARNGAHVDGQAALLDFGCGCGRVIRSWATLRGEVHGCDYDAAGIRWCRRHLPFARFEVNRLEPPLPYAAERFTLVYALSVFTHLPLALQRPWMAELARVLRPGGHLVFSVHGSAYLRDLTPPERDQFEAGRLVVREGPPGSNVCGAYHPEPAIRDMAPASLELLEIAPAGALGNPPQDLVVYRKRALPTGTAT